LTPPKLDLDDRLVFHQARSTISASPSSQPTAKTRATVGKLPQGAAAPVLNNHDAIYLAANHGLGYRRRNIRRPRNHHGPRAAELPTAPRPSPTPPIQEHAGKAHEGDRASELSTVGPRDILPIFEGESASINSDIDHRHCSPRLSDVSAKSLGGSPRRPVSITRTSCERQSISDSRGRVERQLLTATALPQENAEASQSAPTMLAATALTTVLSTTAVPILKGIAETLHDYRPQWSLEDASPSRCPSFQHHQRSSTSQHSADNDVADIPGRSGSLRRGGRANHLRRHSNRALRRSRPALQSLKRGSRRGAARSQSGSSHESLIAPIQAMTAKPRTILAPPVTRNNSLRRSPTGSRRPKRGNSGRAGPVSGLSTLNAASGLWQRLPVHSSSPSTDSIKQIESTLHSEEPDNLTSISTLDSSKGVIRPESQATSLPLTSCLQSVDHLADDGGRSAMTELDLIASAELVPFDVWSNGPYPREMLKLPVVGRSTPCATFGSMSTKEIPIDVHSQETTDSPPLLSARHLLQPIQLHDPPVDKAQETWMRLAELGLHSTLTPLSEHEPLLLSTSVPTTPMESDCESVDACSIQTTPLIHLIGLRKGFPYERDPPGPREALLARLELMRDQNSNMRCPTSRAEVGLRDQIYSFHPHVEHVVASLRYGALEDLIYEPFPDSL
jgi:hypothetical protein